MISSLPGVFPLYTLRHVPAGPGGPVPVGPGTPARGRSYRRVLCAGVRGHKVGTCDILNMHSSPLQDPLLQGRGGGVETRRSRGERGGVMQDPASELPTCLTLARSSVICSR